MRHLFLSSSLGLLLCAVAPPLTCTPAAAQAPDVDALVARNLAAKGGAEKLKAIQTIRIDATATVQGTRTPMVMELKRPNLRRQEVTLNGQTIVQAFDGTTGWVINPATGDQPVQLPPGATAAMKQQSEFDSPLLDYKAKGVTITLVGQEPVDGHDAYHLAVKTKDGTLRDYYLDADTALEFRVDGAVEQNGRKGVLSVAMSDYRDVDGVKLPFSLRQSMDGQTLADLSVSKINLNVPLDASLFRLGDRK